MKQKTNPFVYRQTEGHIVEIWLGTPDDYESEKVVSIDISYVPALIASLRGSVGIKSK
jgi:hypothetical protein